MTALEEHLGQLQDSRGGIKERQRALGQRRGELAVRLADADAVATAAAEFASIEQLLASLAFLAAFDLSAATGIEQATGAELTSRRDSRMSDQAKLRSRVERAMAAFRERFPREASEMDDTLASGPEYRTLHARVAGDDLPRFEREFKEYLNENTIREVAAFAAQLDMQQRTIQDRVATINTSLYAIDYNPDRYIRLLPGASPNEEIRTFRV